jgi:protein N-terminal glutamine amidohydrolase
MSTVPRRHPFYCEENVWHLCRDGFLGPRGGFVIAIAGLHECFAMWHQRAGAGPDGFVAWDYHVIAISADRQVWDVDSTLGAPVAASEYFRRSFRRSAPMPLRPRFRVIDSSEYVRALVSDRSHMRRADGTYAQPPPPWDPIGAPGAEPSFARFIDLSDPTFGPVVELPEIRAIVAGSSSVP